MTNNITALREELEQIINLPRSTSKTFGYLAVVENNADTLINALKVVEAAIAHQDGFPYAEDSWVYGGDYPNTCVSCHVRSREGRGDFPHTPNCPAVLLDTALAALNPTTPSSSTQER